MARITYDNNGNVSDVSLFSNGTRYDRNAALDAIAKARGGLNGDFATQGVNSPYSAEFSPNWLQKIGEWFGDFSARDAFYQSQDQAEMERINSLLEAQRQQSFNDPAAQAARMRAAGQNPDLLGTQGVSDASQVAPDETPPMSMGDLNQQTPSPVPVAGLIATAFGDPLAAIGEGLSLLTAVQDFNIKADQRAWSEVANFLTLHPEMQQFIADTEQDPEFGKVSPEKAELPGYLNWKTEQNRIAQSSSFGQLMKYSGLTERGKKLFKQIYNTGKFDKNGKFTPGLTLKQKELSNKILGENMSKVAFMNSPGFSWDVFEWASERYKMIDQFRNKADALREKLNVTLAEVGLTMNSEDVVVATKDATLAGLKADKEKAEFDADYFNELNPQLAAQAGNAEYQAKIVRNALNAYYDGLIYDYDKIYFGKLKELESSKWKYLNPSVHGLKILQLDRERKTFHDRVRPERETAINNALDALLNGAGSAAGAAIPGLK